MKLNRLFEMQRVLDERIEKEHPRVEGEDRARKKIFALIIEISELANELPELFKFWSNKKNNVSKALTEYVDGLHFFLSLGHEINVVEFDLFRLTTETDEIDWIFEVQNYLLNFDLYRDKRNYFTSLNCYLKLGEVIGFTWEEIEQAYISKNEVNHNRQATGY